MTFRIVPNCLYNPPYDISLDCILTLASFVVVVFPQNITFDEFYAKILVTEGDIDDDKAEGAVGLADDDDEPTDTTPWAGTDRDYSYDEVYITVVKPELNVEVKIWVWRIVVL